MKSNIKIRILRRLGLTKFISLSFKKKLNSTLMVKIPLVDQIGFEHLDPPEPFLSALLNKLFILKEGDFLDVGVHTGETLIKFLELDVKRQYYGFEPSPACIYYVNKLISINRLSNLHLFPIALSDKFQIAELHSRGAVADATSSIVEGYREEIHYSYKQFISTGVGDEILVKLPIKNISIIKIDVEGSELEVLNGLVKTIFKFRPFIYCEILPINHPLAEVKNIREQRADKIQKNLIGYNYSIFNVIEDGTIIKLNTIIKHYDFKLSQYLFCPQELEAQLLSLYNN